MTKDRSLKRRVRARMAATGSSYSAARRAVVAWAHERPSLESVSDEARRTLELLIEAVGEVLPGAVDGWYLVGSAVLGDYRGGRSDVDFVALLRGPLDDGAVEALTTLHGARPGRPVDGVYVTVEQLEEGSAPELLVHDGACERHAPFGARPVLRHELARYGVVVRGRPVEQLRIRDESDELRQWVRDNVEEYWLPWASAAPGLNRIGVWALMPAGVEWGALGISRMLFTATTGQVTSKSGAGSWALGHVDRSHHPVIEEALRVRAGGFASPLSAFERRARLVAYMGDAIRLVRASAPRHT